MIRRQEDGRWEARLSMELDEWFEFSRSQLAMVRGLACHEMSEEVRLGLVHYLMLLEELLPEEEIVRE